MSEGVEIEYLPTYYRCRMQVTPRYGQPPVLTFAETTDTPALAVARQSSRLLETVSSLSAQQWEEPTRCEGWSVRDVISHLVTTNGFWSYSLANGLRGEPSSILSTFDPVGTPKLLVEAAREQSSDEVLERYGASVALWNSQLSELSGDQWDMVAEAPPGHIGVREIAAHSLWDSWTHERDIAVPLELGLSVLDDEVSWSVKYVSALGPALLATTGSTRMGVLGFALSDPELEFTVEIGSEVLVRNRRDGDPAPLVRGDAVHVLESLSCRSELLRVNEENQWMLDGLAIIFEATA